MKSHITTVSRPNRIANMTTPLPAFEVKRTPLLRLLDQLFVIKIELGFVCPQVLGFTCPQESE